MRLLILVLAGVGLTVPLRRYIVEPIVVVSASMEPALPVGARFLADKLTPRLRPPKRGDIVLFTYPAGPPIGVGKRVIGVPGETLELRRKTVFVDGKPLAEPYAVHGSKRLDGDDLGPLFVPAGKVFVLGDNRDKSEDSADWKERFVSVSSITAIVRPYEIPDTSVIWTELGQAVRSWRATSKSS
ncbi:MAG: signal peptidase I [Elusimicrobiota bacterium]|nr:MAG: signal peptidase I [Elusimicrobiota bacterium]